MHRQKEGQTNMGKSLTQQREATDKEMGTSGQKDPQEHSWADVSRGQGVERERQVRQTQRDPPEQRGQGGADGEMSREAAVTRGAPGTVCGSLSTVGVKVGFQGGAV